MPQQLSHRVFIHRIRSQIAVLSIPLQQALPFQKAADTLGDGVRQLGEFGAGRCLDPAEPGRPIGTIGVDAVQEQHMEMDIQVERGAKPLDQRYRSRLGCLFRKTCFLDQMCGEGTVDDTQHLSHERRPAGEQEA